MSADPARCPWDREEFDRIVETRMKSLTGIASRIIGNEDLARDAVQETLLSLWNQREIPDRIGSWLNRAVTLRALHAARTRRRRENHEARGARRSLDAEDSTLDRVRERDDLRKTLAEIGRLPASFRNVMHLRHVDGLDYASVAKELRVPVGTVRSRLARARSILEERLSTLVRDLGCERHVTGTCRESRDAEAASD